jgi:formate-dependent nitrite reductase membrane component NrfD
LFLVSAFSTGAAYALVVLVFVRRHQEGLEQRIEGFDVGLIIFEVLLLLAYFNFASMGSLGVQASIDYLMSQPGFWLGALVLGLLAPLALEFWTLFRHKKSPRLNTALSLLSGVLVLVGGYLLRHYVVYAGVFELPW